MIRIPRLLTSSLVFLLPFGASAETSLDECLAGQNLPQVVRMLAANGSTTYARVLGSEGGIPSSVVPFAAGDTPLAEVMERARQLERHGRIAPIALSMADVAQRICSPVSVPQEAIDGETLVVTAAGLNYAAHAAEAGGGHVVLFPKPAAPTPAFRFVAAPAGVTLLDYEVELAFVVLEDMDLISPPTRKDFLQNVAFFVSNDISDREPILRNATLSGLAGGFEDAKGQPSFFPAGPWLVRGTELVAAYQACGADGLGLRLEVDEGDGFEKRQDSVTSLMITGPHAIIEKLGERAKTTGLRGDATVIRNGKERTYPLAVDEPKPHLPSGSVVLTGTPSGVAMEMPSNKLALAGRGLLGLRSPLKQLLHEMHERAASGEPGAFLAPGDRVRASIDGLGTQLFTIHEPGSALPVDPCEAADAN